MDFKEMVEKYAEIEVTQEEIDVFLPQAKRKHSHIINREGDLNGERNQPWYLATLLGEIINMERFSEYCRRVSIQRIAAETKESTQHNAEMLPQTSFSIS